MRAKYVGPTARQIAYSLHGTHSRASNGWWSLRGLCHGGDSTPPTGGSLRVHDSAEFGVIFKCWRGCERTEIIAAIESATGLTIQGAWEREGRERPHPVRHSRKGFQAPDRVAYARDLWRASQRIPHSSPEHPARMWLARRNLWRPEIPTPSPVRWLRNAGRWRKSECAGAIVALYAPPDDWVAAWPKLPAPTAVELLPVDVQGAPSRLKPDGPPKPKFGSVRGSVCFLGDPRPAQATRVRLLLVEGIADGLAIAARVPETVAVVGGTSGFHPDALGWVRTWSDVSIFADSDEDGLNAARRAQRLFANVQAQYLPSTEDPAEWAAQSSLVPVDLSLARELSADMERGGLPAWEAARIAVLSAPEIDANQPETNATHAAAPGDLGNMPPNRVH